MIKASLCLFFFFIFLTGGFCQVTEWEEYPEGIYKTKDDFIKKSPSSLSKFYPEGVNREDIKDESQLLRDIFFFDSLTGKKLKNVFAISYRGKLYFQYGQILSPNNRNISDKDQTVNMLLLQAFTQVMIFGENYLYTEMEIRSGWEEGLYSNMGLIGSAAMSSMDNVKGIVWDYKNGEFNIFRNCKDLNEFLSTHSARYSQECASKKYNLEQVRLSMMDIK